MKEICPLLSAFHHYERWVLMKYLDMSILIGDTYHIIPLSHNEVHKFLELNSSGQYRDSNNQNFSYRTNGYFSANLSSPHLINNSTSQIASGRYYIEQMNNASMEKEKFVQKCLRNLHIKLKNANHMSIKDLIRS